MVRKLFCSAVIVAVVAVSSLPVAAQFGEGNSPNNLFAQYYTQPGASLVEAEMYNAPHWVPYHVGHSYYTYQPLMPHEMMYQHSRNYYNYYNTGGYYGAPNALNKTTVRWQSGTNHMGPLPFSGHLMQSAKWNWNKHRYCLDGSCGTGLPGLPGLPGKGHGGLHGVGSRLHGHGGHFGQAGKCRSGDCYGYGDQYQGVQGQPCGNSAVQQ
jgi:hypothetical protein